jgi:hypothetical protein
MLPGVTEHELARPDQILSRESLVGSAPRFGDRCQTADAGLRDAINKTKVLVPAFSSRPGISNFRVHDFYGGT